MEDVIIVKILHFYKENVTLVDGFENVVGVIQIKETGYVYSSWSFEKNEKQKKKFGQTCHNR